jgi:hypothetical protein
LTLFLAPFGPLCRLRHSHPGARKVRANPTIKQGRNSMAFQRWEAKVSAAVRNADAHPRVANLLIMNHRIVHLGVEPEHLRREAAHVR